jgi:hypothetical protein
MSLGIDAGRRVYLIEALFAVKSERRTPFGAFHPASVYCGAKYHSIPIGLEDFHLNFGFAVGKVTQLRCGRAAHNHYEPIVSAQEVANRAN